MPLDSIDIAIAQRSAIWRFRYSAWILVILLSIGTLSFVGWIWAGSKVKTSRMWLTAALWCAVCAVAWILVGGAENSPTFERLYKGTFGTMILLLLWVGGTIHALILRRTILRAVASREEELKQLINASKFSRNESSWSPVSHHESETQASQPFQLPATRPSTDGRGAPLPTMTSRWKPSQPSSSPHPAVTPSVATSPDTQNHPGTVDVNTATREELMGLPTLDSAAVDKILQARRDHGGFIDLDHLVDSASLQPHQLVALTAQVSFSSVTHPTRSSSTGRLLDL